MNYNMADAWARVTFVKPRKVLPSTDAHELSLPFGGYSLSNLARDNMQDRNKINSTYWSILSDKWIKFKSNPTGSNTEVKRHRPAAA